MGSYKEDENQVNEELSIVVGSSSTFIHGSWSVLRDEDGTPQLQHIETFDGDDPEKYPITWFLTSSNALSKNEVFRFSEMWKNPKKK